MVSLHQDFRLDDGNEAAFLAKCRIARQRMGIGVNGIVAGQTWSDIDHRAPFGELRAQSHIVLYALAQAIKAFGHGFLWRERDGLGAGIELDAGNDTR